MSEPSVNPKVRLLGEVGTSDKPLFPMPARAPAQPAAPPVSITPPSLAPVQAEPIFLGDSADGADLLNAGEIVRPLAQLCVTPQVQTPFLAAILGPSGAGKTFALRRLAQMIEQLSALATTGGPALQRVVLARVDASTGVEAPVAIASAAYAALIARKVAPTIRACWMSCAMQAAIRTGRRAPPQIVMTISSGSLRPSARSVTRSRPNARV